MQQQQQQGESPRTPLGFSSSSSAPSFRLPPKVSLQDLSPSEPGGTSAVLQQLLGQICTHPPNTPFAPFQTNPTPNLQQLEEQEKLCLRGQRGFRFLDEAYTSLNSLLNSFIKSPQLREAARGAHIPNAVSHGERARLVICSHLNVITHSLTIQCCTCRAHPFTHTSPRLSTPGMLSCHVTRPKCHLTLPVTQTKKSPHAPRDNSAPCMSHEAHVPSTHKWCPLAAAVGAASNSELQALHPEGSNTRPPGCTDRGWSSAAAACSTPQQQHEVPA
jgi:hypothetical protein